VLFFFSGFVFLANEILWTRFLSLIIHNTAHTYALTLTVVLSGIVIGSIATCWFFDRTAHRAMLFGAVQILSGISVLAVLLLPAGWWDAWIDAKRLGQHLWIAASVLLLPAILSGASFPLAMRMVIEHPAVAARHVGRMTAVNTLGGIGGSLATGFLFLPFAGLQASLRLTTGIGVALGIAAWLLLERGRLDRRRWALAAVSVAVWVALPLVSGVRLPEDYLGRHGELVDFREGLNAHLAVIRKDGRLQLEIDRFWQGERGKGHQIMAAHVPMLLHPGPSDVLVIGLGTGQSASRFLMHDVERLDGVDIEGALIPLIREHFESGWMDDERVTLIVEDGRNYLTHTDVGYDVISIEVGQVFRPAAAPLYAREFYESARRHLRPDGIVCQFVSTSLFSLDEFRTVVRTFIEVFPNSVLWYNTTELLLIGTVADGLRLGDEALDRIANDTELARDLQLAHWGGPEYWLNRPHVLAAGFLAGPGSLDELSRGARIYGDDVPWLEYDTALPRPPEESKIIRLIGDHLDPVASILEAPPSQLISAAESVRVKNLRNMEARTVSRPFASLWSAGRHSEALTLLERAQQATPESLDLRRTLGKALSTTGRFAEAIPHYEVVVSADPRASRWLRPTSVSRSAGSVATVRRSRPSSGRSTWRRMMSGCSWRWSRHASSYGSPFALVRRRESSTRARNSRITGSRSIHGEASARSGAISLGRPAQPSGIWLSTSGGSTSSSTKWNS
jgi:spermidine synthase